MAKFNYDGFNALTASWEDLEEWAKADPPTSPPSSDFGNFAEFVNVDSPSENEQTFSDSSNHPAGPPMVPSGPEDFGNPPESFIYVSISENEQTFSNPPQYLAGPPTVPSKYTAPPARQQGFGTDIPADPFWAYTAGSTLRQDPTATFGSSFATSIPSQPQVPSPPEPLFRPNSGLNPSRHDSGIKYSSHASHTSGPVSNGETTTPSRPQYGPTRGPHVLPARKLPGQKPKTKDELAKRDDGSKVMKRKNDNLEAQRKHRAAKKQLELDAKAQLEQLQEQRRRMVTALTDPTVLLALDSAITDAEAEVHKRKQYPKKK